ncbi:shikimate dehydrogenase [Bacillus sp. FSL K6-3431]|uniref:shikimate dehydrogenase n=1 Tax=Bacillus sp. FSL K6-3431 TaxID=2921500 RepID=UPI0030FCFC58
MQKLYGVIGKPIAQSMSPLMHNEEFRQLGINANYQPFHILDHDLKTAVEGMKVIGIEGFNVTSPHKTAIMPFLDSIDPLANAIGAVNTIVRENGDFRGYNTDGTGFIQALQSAWKKDFMNEQTRTLIVGAGGASKAIYYTLLAKGMKYVDICNRSVINAQQLIEDCPYEGVSKALSLHEAELELVDYDLVIQTTSIGMYPDITNSPLDLEHLRTNAFVSDIIYNPSETAFLQQAKHKGAQTQNGIGMFIHQGALAFKMWTGITPNFERMTNIVTEKLGGTTC